MSTVTLKNSVKIIPFMVDIPIFFSSSDTFKPESVRRPTPYYYVYIHKNIAPVIICRLQWRNINPIHRYIQEDFMFLKRWRRLLSFTLILSLCMTSMASAAETSQNKYAWANGSVDFLRSHGVFENMEYRTKTLGRMVTKSDLTLMVHRLFTDLRVESDKNIKIPGVPNGHPSYQMFKDVYSTYRRRRAD